MKRTAVGGANVETMASKDVIGVHLQLTELVKSMINAVNTDWSIGDEKTEGARGSLSTLLNIHIYCLNYKRENS